MSNSLDGHAMEKSARGLQGKGERKEEEAAEAEEKQ
jgi:hypothetical protein